MWVKKEYDSIKRNLSYYEFVIGVFISVVFSATIMMIVPFVTLYTKGVSDVNYILPVYAFVISIAMACYCFRTPYLTLVQGAGHYKETKAGAYLEAGLNLLSSIVLVQFIGIIGTAIGTLLANVIRSFQYAFYIDDHIIKIGKLNIFKRLIWCAVNVLCSCIISSCLLGNIAESGWAYWISCGLVIVIISSIVTFLSSYIVYRKDLIGIFEIGKRMVFKRKRKKS